MNARLDHGVVLSRSSTDNFACGAMANSGSDHIDRNSWKYGPDAYGGTKALSMGSGTMDGRSFVDTGVGERHWNSIYEERRKEQKSRRGKVVFLPVPDPLLGMFRSLNGV